MKKSLKIVATIIILLTTVVLFANNAYAINTSIQANQMTGSSNAVATDEIKTVGNSIIGIALNIAVVAAVITIIIIGIKYIVGSAEQKADYKKSLIPMVVGIALVVFATRIVTMLFGIA